MASILKPIVGKISSLFKRPKPKPIVPSKLEQRARDMGYKAPWAGHRGVAAGNLDEPDLSEENASQWRMLGINVAEAFVYEQELLQVHSSNVSSLQYFLREQKLIVNFKNGSSYMYSGVTEDEAIGFVTTHSKGGEVWTTLRVRGSATAHKKPYVRIQDWRI